MRSFCLLSLLLVASLSVGGCAMFGKGNAITHRVAVVDFENLTGDPECDHLERALGEYLTTYLANSGVILLRDRQDIFLNFEEIEGSDSEAERFSRLQTMGEKVGATLIVVGSISRLEEKYFILNARLFSVQHGEVIPGSAVTVSCAQRWELYHRAQTVGAYLAKRLSAIGAVRYPESSETADIEAETP